MITVHNLNHPINPPSGQEGDVLCDRRTKWGNPFIMYYQSQRDEVCDEYEKYFRIMQIPNLPSEEKIEMLCRETSMTRAEATKWMKITGGFLDIRELKEAKRLFCWDYPRRCHCDFLKKMIEAIVDPEPIFEEKSDLKEFGF
jgi:hypothetical protein